LISNQFCLTLSSSLLRLGNCFPDLETPLLLQNQNLESVEVVQLPPLLSRRNPLGRTRPGPLLSNIGLPPVLGDNTGAGASGKGGDDDAGEVEVCERERLAGHGGVRGVDQDSLVINNLNDSSELPGGRAVVEKDNATNFDEPPLRGLDFAGHVARCCRWSVVGRVVVVH